MANVYNSLGNSIDFSTSLSSMRTFYHNLVTRFKNMSIILPFNVCAYCVYFVIMTVQLRSVLFIVFIFIIIRMLCRLNIAG